MADQFSLIPPLALRFRSFLPVVIDVETGGLNPQKDALLEIAATFLGMDDNGLLYTKHTVSAHVEPVKGLGIHADSMRINGIKLDNPFRFAITEKDALNKIFEETRLQIKENGCTRAILVGHNAHFDLAVLNAATERSGIKKSPFHLFSGLDTVSLSALVYGQTVLAKAIACAGIEWDGNNAHSAVYDTEKTAELFCKIVNTWQEKVGFDFPDRKNTDNDSMFGEV